MAAEASLHVRFHEVFPQRDLDDDQVLMTFLSDEDAALFRDWWRMQGEGLFILFKEAEMEAERLAREEFRAGAKASGGVS